MIRAVVVLLLLVTPAAPHGFYPVDCCSGTDCAPLAPERVKVTSAGYVIDGRHTVPHNQARFSPDAHYHGCFPPSMQGKLHCFWAPRPAM